MWVEKWKYREKCTGCWLGKGYVAVIKVFLDTTDMVEDTKWCKLNCQDGYLTKVSAIDILQLEHLQCKLGTKKEKGQIVQRR